MTSDFPRRGRRGVWLTVALWLVGTLVVCGLAAPAAAQGAAQGYSYGRPAGLQTLVGQLSDQFWFAYRANIPEHRLRHDQLRQAIEAWNESTKTAQDRQLMAQWLRDAMAASMPGGEQPLPPLPDFGKVAELPAPQSTTSNKPIVSDQAAVPMEHPADNQEDNWSSETASASPSDIDKEDSDEIWQSEPRQYDPADSFSPSDNPFGDDPLGM